MLHEGAVDTLSTAAKRRQNAALARGRKKGHLSRQAGTLAFKQFKADMQGPKNFKPWHYEVLRRFLFGDRISDICRATGRSYQAVHTLVKSSQFQRLAKEALGELRGKLVQDITNDPVYARVLEEGSTTLDTLLELRDRGSDDGVRLRAATDLMNRYDKVNAGVLDEDAGGAAIDESDVEALQVAIKEVTVIAQRHRHGKQTITQPI